MKILLDHNLDRRLKADITGHEVATVYEKGWADAKNGELLTLAEQSGFDVLLTADTNISKQQNFAGRRISILVLRAPDNRRLTHLGMISGVLEVLASIEPGKIVEVADQSYRKKD